MSTTTQLVSLDERVGTDISGARDFDDVMNQAGFDFDVEKVPVHDPEGNEVDGHFIVRRTDTKHPFACMKKRYHTIPMEEMLRPFHTMVSEYGLTYENAGIIQNGRKAWIAAKFGDEWGLKNRPEDKMKNRLVCLLANDGTSLNSYFSIANRLFCNNQINYIQKEANRSAYGVRHTKNWKGRLEEAKFAVMLAIENLKEFRNVADKLDSKRMTANQCRGFACQLFPDPEAKAKPGLTVKKDEPVILSSKLINRREKIVDLFVTGAGNQGASRWDALNAVTEFFQHHNNANRLEKHGRKAAERQLVSNLMGGTNDIATRRAVNMLVNEKKFKSLTPAVYDKS